MQDGTDDILEEVRTVKNGIDKCEAWVMKTWTECHATLGRKDPKSPFDNVVISEMEVMGVHVSQCLDALHAASRELGRLELKLTTRKPMHRVTWYCQEPFAASKIKKYRKLVPEAIFMRDGATTPEIEAEMRRFGLN